MKFWFAFIVGLLTLSTFAQEREELRGRVFKNDSILENVTLRNITTGRATLTNQNGYFNLKATVGDTLVFSHVGSADLIKFLDRADMEAELLEVKMKDLVNELEEVNIRNTSEINAVSEGIIPREIKPLTPNERRLAAAGDFKWKHLLGIFTGNVPVDPILNALNGRTKMLKRNILVEQKLKNISILEGYSTYMQKQLNLTEEEAQRIISLAGEEEDVQQVIDSNNADRIKFFLLNTWLKYKDTE